MFYNCFYAFNKTNDKHYRGKINGEIKYIFKKIKHYKAPNYSLFYSITIYLLVAH